MLILKLKHAEAKPCTKIKSSFESTTNDSTCSSVCVSFISLLSRVGGIIHPLHPMSGKKNLGGQH